MVGFAGSAPRFISHVAPLTLDPFPVGWSVQALFPELIDSAVILTNGSGVFSPSLREFAIAAILYFAKDFRLMIRNQQAGVWGQFDVSMISGQTLGIVGYGSIGRTVAVRALRSGNDSARIETARASRARRRFVDRPFLRAGAAFADAFAVRLRPGNTSVDGGQRGLIAEPEFAVMKKKAVIINIGRGATIDEGAMIKALSEHRIRGAALDVFDREHCRRDILFIHWRMFCCPRIVLTTRPIGWTIQCDFSFRN